MMKILQKMIENAMQAAARNNQAAVVLIRRDQLQQLLEDSPGADGEQQKQLTEAIREATAELRELLEQIRDNTAGPRWAK